jgi:hypothetical protein
MIAFWSFYPEYPLSPKLVVAIVIFSFVGHLAVDLYPYPYLFPCLGPLVDVSGGVAMILA